MTDVRLPPLTPDSGGPTHKCIVCGAKWRFNPEYITPLGTGLPASWSVYSREFGQCCDRGPMDLLMIPLDNEAYES